MMFCAIMCAMKNALDRYAQYLRQKIHTLHVAALILSAAFCIPACDDKKRESAEVAAEMEAMGTIVSITAYTDSTSEGQDAVQLAESEIRRLEKLWSATDPESEISALNSSEVAITVSDETAELLTFARDMAKKTGGAFDPTVYPLVDAWGFLTHRYRIPSDEEIAGILERVGAYKILVTGNSVMLWGGAQLDLGGIAKGASGDAASEVLQKSGIKSAIINLGGNVHLVGARPDGQPWRIGIRDPYGKGILGIVAVRDCAVVTSGMYERNFTDNNGHVYHHIMDPATGHPAESGLISVTILAHEGMLADALSTGLFVMGEEKAVAFWREHGGTQVGGFETILVTAGDTVLVSEGVAKVFAPEHEFAEADVRVITRNPKYTPTLLEYLETGALE